MTTNIILGAITITGGRPVLSPDGTGYFFQKLKGWDDQPALRFESIERIGGHGSTAGRGYLSERTVVVEGFIWCPAGDPVKLREATDALTSQLPLTGDALFVVDEHGFSRHLKVRQGGQPIIDRIGRELGRNIVASFSLQLIAMEPRRFSGSGEPTITKPLPFGSNTSLSGGGRIEAPALIELIGPINAGAVLACGGRTLNIGAAVAAGKTLTLDLERRKALLGSVDIGTQVTGLWPAPSVSTRSFNLIATGTGSAQIKAWEAWA